MVLPVLSTISLMILAMLANLPRIFLVNVPVAVFNWVFKMPPDWLYERVYKDSKGQRMLGMVFALLFGVGTAYVGGWYFHWTPTQWVLAGITNALWTYIYRWPFTLLVAVRPVIKLFCNEMQANQLR